MFPNTTQEALALDGTPQRLDPRVRTVWAVGRATVPAAFGLALTILALARGSAAVAIVIALVALLVVALAVASAFWSWRCWKWAAWNDALELQHGVIVRAVSLVPYHRIQQIDLHRGPLERMLSLSTLVLRTAASTTDATLPGVPAPRAEALRHSLLARAGVDDAV